MLVFRQKVAQSEDVLVDLTIYLTAEERLKTQQRLEIPELGCVYLRLPRGEILTEGDRLIDETADKVIQIAAKPELLITVESNNNLDLLKAAYHLGNRHVPLEIKPNYLRFSTDAVLAAMLVTLGLTVKEEIAPFYPETGAYQHNHG